MKKWGSDYLLPEPHGNSTATILGDFRYIFLDELKEDTELITASAPMRGNKLMFSFQKWLSCCSNNGKMGMKRSAKYAEGCTIFEQYLVEEVHVDGHYSNSIIQYKGHTGSIS